MDISLLALDLDGTALLSDRNSFSPRLQAALLAAHRRGVTVVPITGRQFALLPAALPTGAAWEGLCILCNGSEIRRLADGAVLDAYYLSHSLLLDLVPLMAQLELPVELSTGGELYLTQEDWDRQRRADTPNTFHLEKVLCRYGRVVSDLTDICREKSRRFDKVNLPLVPPARRQEVEAALRTLPLSFAWSSPMGIEITHQKATKAQGLRRLCALLGLSPAQAMAIGDSGNDISMLQAAGVGIAMGNAAPEVKAAANAVTCSNTEDGAAAAIERYILGHGLA